MKKLLKNKKAMAGIIVVIILVIVAIVGLAVSAGQENTRKAAVEEFKNTFDSVSTQCDNLKTKIEIMTAIMDENIATEYNTTSKELDEMEKKLKEEADKITVEEANQLKTRCEEIKLTYDMLDTTFKTLQEETQVE